MQAKSTVASDLNLRPIPGPDPVDLLNSMWWLWLVPAILLAFLWYWWSRKQPHRELTCQERMDAALLLAQDTNRTTRERFELLHHTLRDYLTGIDSSWKTLSAAESLPAWEQLFPDRPDLANMLQERWIAAEEVIFGPVQVTEHDVSEYALHLGRLMSQLDMETESKKTPLMGPKQNFSRS